MQSWCKHIHISTIRCFLNCCFLLFISKWITTTDFAVSTSGPLDMTAFVVCSFENLSHTVVVQLCLRSEARPYFTWLHQQSLAQQRHTGQTSLLQVLTLHHMRRFKYLSTFCNVVDVDWSFITSLSLFRSFHKTPSSNMADSVRWVDQTLVFEA